MSAMSVSEAVASRRSIRRFLPDAVDQATILRVLEKAQQAPSGGNMQPWSARVITGAPLQRLIAAVDPLLPLGHEAWDHEYQIYPDEVPEQYTARKVAVGVAMFGALGIARDDMEARTRQHDWNYRAFGAPVLMLVHMPRFMGLPQWADVGMWLQTIMLLLREEGLDSCAQESWSHYHRQVRETVGIPEDHVFYCGLAIGKRDPASPINTFPVPRVSVGDVITFEGF